MHQTKPLSAGASRLFSGERRRLFFAVLGTLILALGVNLFIVPVGLYSGGFLGVGQILRTLLVDYAHLPIPANIDIAGVILYLIDIPLFFLAYRSLGRRIFAVTLVCATMQSVFLTLVPVPAQPILSDPLAAALIGGAVSGYGCGMTLQNGGSCGGQEILGMYFMKRDRSFSVGKIAMLINVVVFAACALMFDLTTVIYSLIYVAVYSFVTDHTHAQNQNVAAIIVAARDDVLPAIRQELARGATYWDGVGSYEGGQHRVIYMVLSKYEAMQLRRVLHQVDPGAFAAFFPVDSIDGNFDKHL